MPTFQVTRQEYHTVIKTYIEEFDTLDQEKWEHFRHLLSGHAQERLSEFPEVAPSDPKIWFDLLQLINHADYEVEVEDDWISIRQGQFKVVYYLEDEYGEVIAPTV
ncbi:MAG: hypothetical protein G3H99_00110 [Ferrovum sp.]|nr:hypothetical protein [Ferrovum sp.]NDU86800.1 hypothetical protein [Ferrovum sp.]